MQQNKDPTQSLEFTEKKILMEREFEISAKKHEMRLRELTYLRETERLKHEWELERGRIKSAEIRKSQERKFRS